MHNNIPYSGKNLAGKKFGKMLVTVVKTKSWRKKFCAFILHRSYMRIRRLR